MQCFYVWIKERGHNCIEFISQISSLQSKFLFAHLNHVNARHLLFSTIHSCNCYCIIVGWSFNINLTASVKRTHFKREDFNIMKSFQENKYCHHFAIFTMTILSKRKFALLAIHFRCRHSNKFEDQFWKKKSR